MEKILNSGAKVQKKVRIKILTFCYFLQIRVKKIQYVYFTMTNPPWSTIVTVTALGLLTFKLDF